MVEQILTTTQAAGVLGVKPKTLENWRAEGYGPEYLALSSRVIRYKLSAVMAWADAKAVA
ncbi:helix-turn-helix transcriptional regulator [Corynebacterium sp. UBA2622]|uniref:helix-turn-helix transcriptional regulator n=1 Tax=Corynebacterium sp. UBA2622 TaxID=1946393 RepID=UPI0025BE4A8A|nr:helix-turn-helix domain-containing protein [Corynebacterium sp. UBA2622]